MSAARVAVALGSNLGDRRAHLAAALAGLDQHPALVRRAVSRWHETEPLGGPPGQGRYLNGVALYDCELAPLELLALLQAIEAGRGREREREGRHGARTLDLDLLLHGDERVDTPHLVVPHARMESRSFVLEPLAEVWPELVLPRSGLCIQARIEELRVTASAGPGGGRVDQAP